jgi:hypothetical protein
MPQNKFFFVTIIPLLLTQLSYAQKTEINFDAYSGLFSFRGAGATSNSYIDSYPFSSIPSKFTINPYGKKSAFSYSLEFQGQRITKRKNIYGFGIGFEELISRVHINKIGISGDPAYLHYPASGKTELKNTFITFNPFVGHIYSFRKVTFDILTGLDLSFCLESNENGNATTTTKDYHLHLTVQNNKEKPSIDFRPRIQIKAQINKLGFLAGYSLGLTNYQIPYNPKAYSSFLRLGLGYCLK